MRLIFGYALVLTGQILMCDIVFDKRYFIISLLFFVGYLCIFAERNNKSKKEKE
jgi:hypothetical protein